MGNKRNIPKGVRQEFDDVDYWHKLSKKKKITLDNGEKISEYEYMKRFMHEAYGNNFSRKNPEDNIIQTDEQKKWARRNNNNTNRDALLVAKKMGALNALFDVEENEYPNEDEHWEKVFKTGTYEDAAKELLNETCNNLQIKYTIVNARALFRFYFRIKRFLKLVREDMKTNEGN